uniref:Uncharacterized protein n=1 Tax=Arundo donax TaxID=35708 RepID=A0A0A8YMK7_ARUDO
MIRSEQCYRGPVKHCEEHVLCDGPGKFGGAKRGVRHSALERRTHQGGHPTYWHRVPKPCSSQLHATREGADRHAAARLDGLVPMVREEG